MAFCRFIYFPSWKQISIQYIRDDDGQSKTEPVAMEDNLRGTSSWETLFNQAVSFFLCQPVVFCPWRRMDSRDEGCHGSGCARIPKTINIIYRLQKPPLSSVFSWLMNCCSPQRALEVFVMTVHTSLLFLWLFWCPQQQGCLSKISGRRGDVREEEERRRRRRKTSWLVSPLESSPYFRRPVLH